MEFKLRVTGVLIENEKLLLLEQDVTADRRWSLPGGGLEYGETIGDCLAREMREETGLDVEIGKLLYVCDRMHNGKHVVHMTFLVQRTGGELKRGEEPEAEANRIRSIKLVPLTDLPDYGFSARFCELAMAGFPGSGTYQGDIANIGL
jgi:ADP-ribose pyrophosphatase YjhB (NUDIX family)